VAEEKQKPPSLAEEQKQLTRARIRAASMEVVARRGFAATVEEIAHVANVSPRTVFRHYTNHDQLIIAAVKDIFEACGRRANHLGNDVDDWLDGLATTIHTRNAEILGEAFWDIHAAQRHASDVLLEVDALRRESRTRGVSYLTSVAWRAAGGSGDPPAELALAFALNFSAFTTQALMVDFDQTPAQIGALTADTLKVLLRRAVETQRGGGAVAVDDDGTTG